MPYLRGTVSLSPGTTSVIQQRVRALLDGVIVVGFAFHNDLSVLGVTLSPDIVRDVQKFYTPERCAELSLCGLPTQQPGQMYALKDLVLSPSGQVIHESPHSALEDANATTRLYLWGWVVYSFFLLTSLFSCR